MTNDEPAMAVIIRNRAALGLPTSDEALIFALMAGRFTSREILANLEAAKVAVFGHQRTLQ